MINEVSTDLVNKQYGKWNAILAENQNTSYVFYQNHSKLFPEELSDWILAIKKATVYKVFAPVRLDTDITNYCQNNCTMCFAKELRAKYLTFIPLNHLITIFNNFKKLGGKSVRLTGGGEPLSHPNIIEIIEQLAKLKLKITIETNGDLINSNLADVIAKYVHHFRISVDSSDNETREKVHKPCSSEFTYDRLVEKIREVRQKSIIYHRDKELFIGATFVTLPENYLAISQFVADMYEMGVNWVALRKNIYREVYENNPKIIPFIESEIKRLKKIFENNPKDFTIEEQYAVSFNPKEDFNECWVSYIRPIILANRSLQLCCLARNGIMPLADIGCLPATENPIEDLIKNHRDQIDKFRISVPKNCRFCIDKDNNISFSNVTSLLKIDPNFKFTKANVVLSDKNYFIPRNYKITEIGLISSQFEQFKYGTLVSVINPSCECDV